MNSATNFDLSKKPKVLMCYLCGREFGSSSLQIHFNQCKLKIEGDKKQKIETPFEYDEIFQKIKNNDKISPQEIEEFNNFANELYKSKTLIQCKNCGRKFDKERLEVHSRSCVTPNKESLKKFDVKEKTTSQTDSKNLFLQKLEKELEKEGGIKKSPKNIEEESKSSNKGFKETKENDSPQKKKPQFLMCFFCGREFSRFSLEIHINQCSEKFKTEAKNKDPKAKVILPEAPSELLAILEKTSLKQEVSNSEIEEYNAIANNIYKEKSMATCPGCHRKFISDRLEVHLRGCKAAQSSGSGGAFEGVKTTNMATRPRMLMCPLCGREFGTMSLDIHIKTCIKKFDQEQQNLPKNLRKSAETIIEKFRASQQEIKIHGSSQGSYGLDQMNEVANEIYQQELSPCDICGRTFLPDRLIIHQRSCKPKEAKAKK